MELLKISAINTFYGLSHILFDVSLSVNPGECIFLLGRNGAGKTTTFRSIMQLAPIRTGSVEFKGIDISKYPPNKIAKYGIGFVPEDRRIFSDLSVRENLEIGIKEGTSGSKWNLDRIFDLFPILKKREKQDGITLSGGEQQMLTIARTLLGNPDLILLDEPTEGLDPIKVKTLIDQLAKIKQEGITMLISEHSQLAFSKIGDRAYLMEKGRIGWEGTVKQLAEDEAVRIKYLGVS
jgi:branched-chain amino acid transport system ATP-binding protein